MGYFRDAIELDGRDKYRDMIERFGGPWICLWALCGLALHFVCACALTEVIAFNSILSTNIMDTESAAVIFQHVQISRYVDAAGLVVSSVHSWFRSVIAYDDCFGVVPVIRPYSDIWWWSAPSLDCRHNTSQTAFSRKPIYRSNRLDMQNKW